MKNEIEDIGSNMGEKWRDVPDDSYIAGLESSTSVLEQEDKGSWKGNFQEWKLSW